MDEEEKMVFTEARCVLSDDAAKRLGPEFRQRKRAEL